MHRTTYLGMLLTTAFLLALCGRDLFAQAPGAPSGTPIRLQRVTFDPGAGEPALPPALRSREQAGPNTFLVQFGGPVQAAWKVAVAQAGARLYGYVPEHAFVARMDAAALAAVRALPFVRWVGLYHPAYRLDAALDAGGTGSASVEVQTLPDADLDALDRAIAGWGGAVLGRSSNEIAGYLRAKLPAARLGDLAAQDTVLWVAPFHAPQLHNNTGGGQIMRANEVRQSLRLFGAGQIVAVADTGLDVGDPATIHPDFAGRLVKAYCLGRPSPCDWSDIDAHGTHVSGSVLGSGKASGSNPATHSYPASSYAGVAPEAKLVMQSIEASDGSLAGIPNDIGDLMRQAYSDGARVHTNSWGGPTGGSGQFPQYGGYVQESQQVDLAAWQRKNMLILFSAGNSGTDANGNGVIDLDSIGAPGTAKNIMTVGASENLRATGGYNPGGACSSWGDCWFDDFGADPLANDTPSDDKNGLAAFSSRGPTDDGRIKPEIVAPGTNILSTRSHHPQAGTGWGPFNADYIFEGGTSMSTPLTAGAAAVAREWLGRMRGIANPSSALIKSVLINGAADMSPGQYGTGATQEIPSRRPNNVTGWGRVDLVEALNPAAPRKIWLADNTGGLATGGSAAYTLNVTAAQGAPAARQPVQLALNKHFAATMVPHSGAIGPQAGTQLLANGGFENATLAPWDTASLPELDTSVKHSGTQSVHLDGIIVDDDIQQAITIPANASAATIDFWYQLSTSETAPDSDAFCYGLWDSTGSFSYLEECGDFAVIGDTGWVHETRALTAGELASVAGQSVIAAFYLITDFSLPSEAWVDDAALQVTTSGGVTPTPLTPTATTPPSGPGDPLRVTLAWTDYPGEPSVAKALVNDLDLEVIAPNGTHYYGNQGVYSSGQCLRDSKWDACNNLEGIIIPKAGAGPYTIIVHGAQVPQGGAQPFALVASGNGLLSPPQRPVFLPLVTRGGAGNNRARQNTPTPTRLPAPAAADTRKVSLSTKP